MRLPWSRAPRAALSSPVTVSVAVVTGAVVAFVAAGTVFHVSSTGAAAVQYLNDRRCADDSGVLIERTSRGFFAAAISDGLDAVNRQLHAAAARHDLDLVRRTRFGSQLPMTIGGRTVEGRLAARDGAQQHVRPVAGGGTDGAWIPDELAQRFGVGVGDELVVDRQPDQLRVPVTAVYPTINEPVDEFWCSQRRDVVKLLLVPDSRIKPPMVLVSPELMDRLTAAGLPVEMDRLQVTSSRLPANRDEAERHAAAVTGFLDDVEAMHLNEPRFDQSGRRITATTNIGDRAAYPAASAQRAQRAVAASLLPLTGVSLLVGLAGVVGLAAQWLQRRYGEIRLLWVRGCSPAALAGKAVLELAVPLAAGAALGWAAARLSVRTFAPAAEIDGWAPGLAAAAATAAWLACLVVLAAAAALRVRREFQPRPRAGRAVGRALRWLPWELVAGALAVVSWRRLAGGALVVSPSELLPRVDVLALMFPLLCLAVLTGLAIRLAGLALHLQHRFRGWRWPAMLWAARRAAAQRRLLISLLAVAGLAVGVIAVGIGISHTERQAVLDKGRLFVGSDTAVRMITSIPEDVGLPPELRGSSTQVAVRDDVVAALTTRVLVVDPATVADGMPWREQWAGGASLAELAGRLGQATSGGRMPAIAVGEVDVARLNLDGLPPVEVVGTADAFPGMEHADGMIVIPWEAILGGNLSRFTRYVLTRTDAATAVRELERAGEPTGLAYTAAKANDALPFLVVAWTFDFFVLLGTVLAAVAAGALLVAIEARRRAAAVAHSLLARMGLRARSMYASYVAELAALAAAAVAVGLLGAWLVLQVATTRLDPAPWLHPVPVPASLRPLALAAGLVAVLTVLAVAAVAVLAARRAPVRELLRG